MRFDKQLAKPRTKCSVPKEANQNPQLIPSNTNGLPKIQLFDRGLWMCRKSHVPAT